MTRTDALGWVWKFEYDAHGNLVASQTPEQAKVSTRSTYRYDPALHG
ncbi:RHS repeat domain-containing protein, partial [Thauera sinica]